jgi:hypothetical protein
LKKKQQQQQKQQITTDKIFKTKKKSFGKQEKDLNMYKK